MFSDKSELTHVLWHEIDTGSAAPVASKPYNNDKDKQGIIDYYIRKMLVDDVIIASDSPFALQVVLCRKNNGKFFDDFDRSVIDYR